VWWQTVLYRLRFYTFQYFKFSSVHTLRVERLHTMFAMTVLYFNRDERKHVCLALKFFCGSPIARASGSLLSFRLLRDVLTATH